MKKFFVGREFCGERGSDGEVKSFQVVWNQVFVLDFCVHGSVRNCKVRPVHAVAATEMHALWCYFPVFICFIFIHIY